MFDKWVSAHEFEWYLQFVIYAALFGGCAIWWLLASISAIRRERRKQREDGIR